MAENVNDFTRIYNEFLDTRKTKLARYQAKRSLERKINAKGTSSVKDLILHLLHQKGHHVFNARDRENKNKIVYYIGTRSSRLLNLNKTTYEFAKYLIDNKHCHKANTLIDFDKMSNKDSIYPDNWLVHVNSINITDVLLNEENFGKFSNLVSYINDLKSGTSEFLEIYSVYDKEQKKLDVFEEDVFNTLSEDRYIKLVNVSKMIKEVLKNVDVVIDKRNSILGIINTEFHFRVNKLVGEI